MAAKDWEWNARLVMADRGMFKISDLVEPLRAQGIEMSREQIYRIITGRPRRINVDVLMALCIVLNCETTDLLRMVPAREGSAGAPRSRGGAMSSPSLAPRDTEFPFAVTVHGPQ